MKIYVFWFCDSFHLRSLQSRLAPDTSALQSVLMQHSMRIHVTIRPKESWSKKLGIGIMGEIYTFFPFHNKTSILCFFHSFFFEFCVPKEASSYRTRERFPLDRWLLWNSIQPYNKCIRLCCRTKVQHRFILLRIDNMYVQTQAGKP
jgi:hypothetical protein